MQFLNSKTTHLENIPSRNVQNVMLQTIIHNYHDHSDNTQNFSFKKLQKLVKNSNNDGTITPN